MQGEHHFFLMGCRMEKKMEDKPLSEVKFSGQSFTGMEKQNCMKKPCPLQHNVKRC